MKTWIGKFQSTKALKEGWSPIEGSAAWNLWSHPWLEALPRKHFLCHYIIWGRTGPCLSKSGWWQHLSIPSMSTGEPGSGDTGATAAGRKNPVKHQGLKQHQAHKAYTNHEMVSVRRHLQKSAEWTFYYPMLSTYSFITLAVHKVLEKKQLSLLLSMMLLWPWMKSGFDLLKQINKVQLNAGCCGTSFTDLAETVSEKLPIHLFGMEAQKRIMFSKQGHTTWCASDLM